MAQVSRKVAPSTLRGFKTINLGLRHLELCVDTEDIVHSRRIAIWRWIVNSRELVVPDLVVADQQSAWLDLDHLCVTRAFLVIIHAYYIGRRHKRRVEVQLSLCIPACAVGK